MKKTLNKTIKALLYIVGGLLAVVLVLAVVLWIKSPGTADPIIGLNGEPIVGSISTIEKVILGGQEQYLIIRGEDSTKPVILFIHGGPGFPETAIMKKLNKAIEKDFVMVYWEQRGAGKSYSKDIPAKSMTIAQLVSDTRELSELLAKRFKKKKIYLMGHSWGSFLAISTAYQYPELYYSFFGVSQICYQYKGEKIGFEWVKDEANKRNDKEAIKSLSEINFPDSLANGQEWMDHLGVERSYLNKYGAGVAHEMTGMWPLMKMFLNAKEYTLSEKMNSMSGMKFSMEDLWPEMISKNLFNEIDSMQLPVYIFQGIHDRQTPYSIAKEFFDQLKAPEKEFFTFENSAHSPLVEEVDKFNSIVREKALEESGASRIKEQPLPE
jgi:pimeloyl-ACP methyl ester carboxylesterase